MEQAVLIEKDLIELRRHASSSGRSTLVMSLCEKVARIAQVEVPVLVTGRPGRGKSSLPRPCPSFPHGSESPLSSSTSAAVA